MRIELSADVYPRHIREIFAQNSSKICIGLCALYAILLSLLSAASPLSSAYPSIDSGVFTYIGEHILQGQMPYLDIFDHKGPLLYVINAIAAALSGPQDPAGWGLWACEIATLLVSIEMTFCTCRRFSGPIASTVATCIAYGALSYSLYGGNYTEEFALVPVSIALYLFSGYVILGPLSKASCAGVGITAGAAFLLQPNMVAVWAVFGSAILVHMGFHGEKSHIVSTIAWALGGFCLMCAPFLLWIFAGGAWDAFIDCYFHFNSEYAATFGQSDLWETMLWQLSYPVAYISVAAIVVMCFLSTKQRRFFWAIYAISFVVALGFSSLSGRHYMYYLMTLIPYFSLPIAAGISTCMRMACGYAGQLKGSSKQIYQHPARGAVTGALVCIVVVLLGLFDADQYRLSLHQNMNAYQVLDQDSSENESSIYNNGYEVVSKVDELSDPDDQIVVCYGDAWIFVESHRSSASRYIFQPEDTRLYIREQLLWQDVERTQPKLVVIPRYAMYFLDYLHGLPGYSEAWSDSGHVIYERVD